MISPPPWKVGRYWLCDQIGVGGMASIHLGRMRGPYGFSRTVAIKRLHPQFAQNPQFVAMFTDEARLAVRIQHANVICPMDVVTAGNELFIVMEYVNGESLATLLQASNQPLSPPLASAIIGQALLGLHAAHEATAEDGTPLAIVHRDASPQNILVGCDGVARMLDFGIAKAAARSQITEKGKLKGKIGYFAPEQLGAAPVVDRRTDIFAMGIVLWEALTGASLFGADSLQASLMMVLQGAVTRPSALNPNVSTDLDALVLRALAPAPDQRFSDAHAMAEALHQAVAPASPVEVGQWVERWMGDTLAQKAALVRRIEALPLDPHDEGSAPRAGWVPTQILPAEEPSEADAGAAENTLDAAATDLAPGAKEQDRNRRADGASRRDRWRTRTAALSTGAAVLVLGAVIVLVSLRKAPGGASEASGLEGRPAGSGSGGEGAVAWPAPVPAAPSADPAAAPPAPAVPAPEIGTAAPSAVEKSAPPAVRPDGDGADANVRAVSRSNPLRAKPPRPRGTATTPVGGKRQPGAETGSPAPPGATHLSTPSPPGTGSSPPPPVGGVSDLDNPLLQRRKRP